MLTQRQTQPRLRLLDKLQLPEYAITTTSDLSEQKANTWRARAYVDLPLLPGVGSGSTTTTTTTTSTITTTTTTTTTTSTTTTDGSGLPRDLLSREVLRAREVSELPVDVGAAFCFYTLIILS